MTSFGAAGAGFTLGFAVGLDELWAKPVGAAKASSAANKRAKR